MQRGPRLIVTTYNVPDVGPPGLASELVPVLLEEYDTEQNASRRRTPTPPPAHAAFLLLKIPDRYDAAPLSQPETWRPASPPPEALNRAENERPASWKEGRGGGRHPSGNGT